MNRWKSASTIKFKTKKEAEESLDLMKNHNESNAQFKNLRIEKINGNKLNHGYIVRFEYSICH